MKFFAMKVTGPNGDNYSWVIEESEDVVRAKYGRPPIQSIVITELTQQPQDGEIVQERNGVLVVVKGVLMQLSAEQQLALPGAVKSQVNA